MKKYYVYTLSYNDVIFYIGKGTKNRMFIHEQRAIKGIKSNNNSALFNKINEILQLGEKIVYNKIFETDDELEAYRIEYDKIEEIGLDKLCNLTKDYLKTSVSDMVKLGLKKSEKWKEAVMNKKSDETREHYRVINTGENNPRYGKKNTKEHMECIKKSLIGVPKSPEHRDKISKALTGIKRSDEFRNKLSDSLKNSEKLKEVTQSIEFRNKHKHNTTKRHEELITYYFEYNGNIIIHKGGLKNMSDKYEISFYNLKRLRYGIITEYKGWKFISIDNKSFTKKLN
jgi:hypothetical protein